MGSGSEIRNERFTPVRARRGYDMGLVDALLDALAEAADRGERLAPLVERFPLGTGRLREGYAIDEVDDFVERITGVRPQVAEERGSSAGPVVQKQRGLLSRAFGRDS